MEEAAVRHAHGHQVVIPVEDFLAVDFDGYWKARLATEGKHRFVYCEASNEAFDSENERVLKSALLGSADLFLKVGNVDLDHLTILGLKLGITNPREYELGRPVEVRDSPAGVYVKSAIYDNADPDTGAGKWADWWWKTQDLRPPMVWHPSVGGRPKARKRVYDTVAKSHRTIITEAEWVNLAFARQPVNLSVPAVSVEPVGPFAKSVLYALAHAACDCEDGEACACDGARPIAKTLTAGYGTDVAALTGGAALRRQSLEGRVADLWDPVAFTRFLRALGTDACAHTGRHRPITKSTLEDHFRVCEGLNPEDARVAAEGLLGHVRARLSGTRSAERHAA